MDQLDLNLLDAWNRVGKLCQRDRVEALKRFRRTRGGTVASRPIRAWCLCVRAADTRIDPYRCIMDPPGFAEEHMPHVIRLDGKLIRFLTKPIVIPWPGKPAHYVAPTLGMSTDMVRRWMKKGWLQLLHHDYCRMWSLRCRPIPIVYTPSPIDPNNVEGRPPDAMWGSLWQWMAERFPLQFVQKIKREPRFRIRKGEHYFRGWDWVCPGLQRGSGRMTRKDDTKISLRVNGRSTQPLAPFLQQGAARRVRCGRRCKYLYAPMPVWTLGKSMGGLALEMPNESGLAGLWEPGVGEPELGFGRRRFACKHCWGVRNITLTNASGWNDFITHISGGLLYGNEVQRPDEFKAKVRKRRFANRRPRKPKVPVIVEVEAKTA